MSKVYTHTDTHKNISLTDRRQRLRTLYFILAALKTPDVNKQNH